MPIEHNPAPPLVREPPDTIKRLSQTLRHPDVASAGLTTTSTGEWALLVRTRSGKTDPIPAIEKQAKGHPVIYLPVGKMPIARPAYPAKGE